MSLRTILLGTAQDGGIPHIGCRRSCCLELDETRRRLPCCLGIVDPQSGQRWLIDCTPEFPRQLRNFDEHSFPTPDSRDAGPTTAFHQRPTPAFDGILITHAHIGHYAGLIFLGAEAMATRNLPLFTMPRMRRFLEANEPWNRLIHNQNVELHPLADAEPLRLNERITVTPISVPHRDEFSETAAFVITGPDRSVLYLPDIDDWELWSTRIEDVIERVDVAYLDGTFFDAAELPQRDQDSVPHPRMIDSLKRFAALPNAERSKIRFIHFNHTNPALIPDGDAERQVIAAGMNLAAEMEMCPL